MDRLTRERYVERAVWPIGRGDRNFWISVAVLSAAVLAGLYAWIYQLRNGLGVTGLNQKVSWGFYIINCVFFIGISYGGAMTSAILRLTNAKWRRSRASPRRPRWRPWWSARSTRSSTSAVPIDS